MILAPIILFAYNRPEHTRKTLTALGKNLLSDQSLLHVFCDGIPGDATENDIKHIQAVRKVVKEQQWCGTVAYTFREKNLGLRDNILTGVTEMLDRYGKIIVLEDDIYTSPWFLDYMNRALEVYVEQHHVYHISGYSLPLKHRPRPEAYFFRAPSCWGWGTWTRAWKALETDNHRIQSRFTPAMIQDFNMGGVENFWDQLLANQAGQIKTWAIFWYASIFLKQGLCLHPTLSYTRNLGWDGTGAHCRHSKVYLTQPVNDRSVSRFPESLTEDQDIYRDIQAFYRKNRSSGIKTAVRKLWKSRGM